MWHTIGLGIGGPAVFDPGCMMISRIETVLDPGINDGLSPYLRITTPGQGLVSVPVRASVVCAATSRANPAEAAAKPIFNADLRSILSIRCPPRCYPTLLSELSSQRVRCGGSLRLLGSCVEALAGHREVPKRDATILRPLV